MIRSGLLAGAFMLMAGFGYAQKIQVKETEMDVNGIPRIGQQIRIQLDGKLVEKAWEKELQANAGKMKTKKGVGTIDYAELKPVSKTPVRIVSTVSSKAEGTFVWWAVDLGNSYISKDGTPSEYEAAEEFLKNFARRMYREDIEKQVTEAEKVLKSSESEADRVAKQADDIKYNIEKNKQKRLDLEAELAKNAEELKQLEKDVDNNLKQQEAAKKQVDNMRAAVEAVKAKLDKIE